MAYNTHFIPSSVSIKSYFQEITVVIHTFSTLNTFLSTFNQFENDTIDMSGFGQFYKD